MSGDHGAVRLFIKHNAHVVKPLYAVRRFGNKLFEQLGLIGKVAAAQRVKIVYRGGIVGLIRRLYAALRHHGVGIAHTKLCYNGHLCALIIGLYGCRSARSAAADYKHVGIVVYIVQLYILAQNAAFAVQQVAQLRGNLIALVGAYGKINKAVLTVVRMKPAKQLVLFLRAHTLKLRAYSLRSACFHSFYRIQHFLCQHLFFLPISRCLCGCTYPEAPQAACRRSRLRHR